MTIDSENSHTSELFSRDAHGKPLIGLLPAELYAFGHLVRSTEELLLAQFSRGLVSGTTHTCLGQELCQMSVVRALDEPDDAILSNHRNHGHFLTYSGDFDGLVGEVMGRESGVCGGRGGSQHIAYRHFHSNGVQAGMSGIAVGLGLARRLEGSRGIVTVIVGDGTLGEGLLYESLNLASIWDLPVLFVVEHNRIAQTTETSQTIGGDIEARGTAFGVPTWRYSDDAPDFCEHVSGVVSTVRSQGRPGLLVIDTRRLGPHSKGDDLRPEAELEAIRRRDPLSVLGARLGETERTAIEQRNHDFLEQVRERANAATEAHYPVPPRHVFSMAPNERATSTGEPAGGRGQNVRTSLNGALQHLLESSGKTILLGEDLHDPYGGAFKVTAGLTSEHPTRVRSTPISEAGITGAAIGLSMAGFEAIVEVMFADFLTLCADQLYNHAVKFGALFPEVEVPLVIRAPSGGRRGYGPTHSQSPENLFTSIPGLTVVFPSHRHDVDRLLVDASRVWRHPVLFLEHKLLYTEVQEPRGFEVLAAHDGDLGANLFPTLVRPRTDPDVSIATFGGMLPVVEKAAAYLEEEEELSVEIVVPSLLSPFPRHSVIDHLRSRRRLAVVEESHVEFGVAAEVFAMLLEAGFAGRVVRIGTPPVPIPSSRSLERQILPSEDRVIEEILKLF